MAGSYKEVHVFLMAFFYFCFHLDKDCADIMSTGHTKSGIYEINPDGLGRFKVYCDMTTDGGGWTVFQRRSKVEITFNRGWTAYREGFGELDGDFWLGNDKLHRLTARGQVALRVELQDWRNERAHAKYGRFSVASEAQSYTLKVARYLGTAGDSLVYHHNMPFSANDVDNDRWARGSCARDLGGAWWFNNCHHSNLNGALAVNGSSTRGITWSTFRRKSTLKFSEMKLRVANEQ